MNTLVRDDRSNERAQREQFAAPSASVIENYDGYTLQVEMPGVNKEGLEISVENNELTITGRRSMPKSRHDPASRIARGKFPARVRIGSVHRHRKDQREDRAGVVTLQLPKAEHVKPRKISVG